MQRIEIISGRERDLGGFFVRRILPSTMHRMVGPFIFFDHMGPATFSVGEGVDVRPHPHINLATVTYLFEGQLCHRDSLGSVQLIEPGAVNWMTAGHGIVHSERTPLKLRETRSMLHGIQSWVALPQEDEEMEPRFTHYPKEALPEFQNNAVQLKLLLGTVFDRNSPVVVNSDIFYLDAQFPINATLFFPVSNEREAALYVVEGCVRVNDVEIHAYSMAVGLPGEDMEIVAVKQSRVMLLGGRSLGQRYIYWNFVSSSEQKIQQAKHDWKNGPGEKGSRFPQIPGDNQEFIPLPAEEGDPKGSIM